jgi:hypothetical protein
MLAIVGSGDARMLSAAEVNPRKADHLTALVDELADVSGVIAEVYELQAGIVDLSFIVMRGRTGPATTDIEETSTCRTSNPDIYLSSAVEIT